MPEFPPIPEAILEVCRADGARQQVKVTKSPFFIGRGQAAGNDLLLEDKRISRTCAMLSYADGGFRLEDRGQRHGGIFVNGEKIASRLLQDGDTISFGLPDSPTLVFRRGPASASVEQLLDRLEQTRELEPGTSGLRQLSLLLEATALLQSQLPLEDILAKVVDHAIELTGADRGVLLQAEAKGEPRPVLARQRGAKALPPESVRMTRTAVAQALEKQKSVVVEDVARVALREAKSVVEQELRSVVAIPLLSLQQRRAGDMTFVPGPEDLLGLLYLDSRRPLAFSQLDRKVLDALATEAADVLDNARLVLKEMERKRLEQELTIAREIQQALLPKGFKPYPHFQVTGVNRSCLAVGGDYFDLMELDAQRTAFVIADVCGKGLGAALVTAMLQGTFSAMTLGQEPAQVFAHVNRFICEHSEVRRYATLFFGILGRDGGLTYLNAGHLPPLLVRGGKVEHAMASESLPIGLIPEAEFCSRRSKLEPGDTLVLYTDGVNEAVDVKDEQFTLERLQETVGRHAGDSVEELQAAILAELDAYTRDAYQADDITLLILRYLGGTTR
ncbi:MAG: SpoIIE family protein phosphatase [Acidobacteria bacterium]|nr:SpoIIE family protein phosphatase [Acidobacteriota bacterium]